MTPVFPAPAICWMLNLSMNDSRSLILGVGNPLRRDDGVGVEIIRRLTKNFSDGRLSVSTDLMDGGTDGLALLEYIKGYKKVTLIDAVEMGVDPGIIKVFTPEEAILHIGTDSLSTHGFGIAEFIRFARELNILPECTIIGIQPEDIGYGEELSYPVQSGIEKVISIILNAADTAL